MNRPTMRIGRWQVWVAPDEFVWLEYVRDESQVPQFSGQLAPVDAVQLARSLFIAAGEQPADRCACGGEHFCAAEVTPLREWITGAVFVLRTLRALISDENFDGSVALDLIAATLAEDRPSDLQAGTQESPPRSPRGDHHE